MVSWEIYTDGACRNNGTPRAEGGIGVYIKVGPTHLSLARPLHDGTIPTSNRAELWAIIAAIRIYLIDKDHPPAAYIYTDCQYCIDCWIKCKQMIARIDAPPENEDLIVRLVLLRNTLDDLGLKLRINKVKGHSHSEGNAMADKLATWAADHQKLDDKTHSIWIKKLLSGDALTRGEDPSTPIAHKGRKAHPKTP